MSKRWKIGLVGCERGSAYGHFAHQSPLTEIIALCDRDPKALGRLQKDLSLPDDRCFSRYEDFINSSPKLDAVVIGTPIPAHAEQAVMALDAGIHVMSEVTASNTIEGCTAIIEAARRSGRIYFIAENTIFRPLFREWESMVRSGRLGEIIYAEADYIHPIFEMLHNPKTGERYWRADRPPVHYCSHSLGPLLYLTGDRVVRAMAVGNSYRILPGIGVGAIDIQLAVFETVRGMIIKMTRTQVAPRHRRIHYYHLQGTKGFVETDRRGGDCQRYVQSGLLYIEGEMDHTQVVEWPELDPEAPDWATLGEHGTSDYGTFMAFLTALDSGRRPALNEVFAWNITVPGLVAAESALRAGEWLEVPAPPGDADPARSAKRSV
jgi:predicted dehydrogenase